MDATIPETIPETIGTEAVIPESETTETIVTQELLAIMSASIAAYLGKNVRIRRARFISNQGPSSWSQLGRVSIQSSHTFSTTK
jgi:methylmalonyl-CoA carboxyltransferase 12S subunit